MNQSPMTKEEMESEIKNSDIRDPSKEFDDAAINETIRALNLTDNNVPITNPE